MLGLILAFVSTPALLVGGAAEDFASPPKALAGSYSASAKCQLVRISPYTIVGYIEGSSAGAPDGETARREALRDVDR
jgi:hypothetical protein